MINAAPIPSPPEREIIKQPINDLLVDTDGPEYGSPGLSNLIQEESPPCLLQELDALDRLVITKRLQVKSVIFLRGKRNRFFIRSSDHKLIYTVEEENKWWVGYLCYGLRPLRLRVLTTGGREVLRIDRHYAFTTRVFPCQLQHVDVMVPPDRRIGTIDQVWSVAAPTYAVKDASGEVIFNIKGPALTIGCFQDVQFNVQRADGTNVGATCKRWQGLLHALVYAPITDKFGLAFDVDLNVKEKALLLAASLLIDYMYYDS